MQKVKDYRILKQLQATIFCVFILCSAIQYSDVSAENKLSDSNFTNNSSATEQLWYLIDQLESRLNIATTRDTGIESGHQLLSATCNLPNIEQLQAQILRAEATALRKRYGLELRSAYTSGNIQTDAGDASAYAELSWDILLSGYLEHRHDSMQRSREALIKEKGGQLREHSNHVRCRKYNITRQFTGLLSELLDIKYQLMKPVHAIERRAYFKGWSRLDDYLVSEEDLNAISDELAFLINTPGMTPNSGEDLSQVINPPLIDLDLNAIISAIKQDRQPDEVTTLKTSLLKDKKRRLYQNRLRVFVRKEFDVSNQHNSNNDGAVFGIRFQMPLENRHSHNIDKLKGEALTTTDALNQWERINRTRQAYLAVKEQLRRSTRQTYRIARAQERVRRTLLQHNMGDDNSFAVAATQLRTLLSANIEMVRTKEQLYHRINNLFNAAAIEFDPTYIKPLSIEFNQFRGRTGERDIYIWSDAFNNSPNQQILELLNIKGINTALVSASSKSNKIKLAQFIKTAALADVEVIPVLGKHHWTFKKNHQQAVTTIAIEAERNGGIHLDIEPHILPGYKENRSAYMKDYTRLIREVNHRLNGLHLSLAVPLHWEKPVYRELGMLADEIYLMAYENRSKERIVKRLLPLLTSIPRQKVVVALRTSDFSDEWQMEQAIDYIAAKTGIHKFAIHQYKTFVQQAGMRP